MRRNLIIHPRADLDQLETFTYLARQSPDAARRFLDAVEAGLLAIAENPESGHRYLNAKRTDEDWRYLRLPTFKNYFAFYRLTDSQVEVVRIVHGSRDLDGILRVL